MTTSRCAPRTTVSGSLVFDGSRAFEGVPPDLDPARHHGPKYCPDMTHVGFEIHNVSQRALWFSGDAIQRLTT